MRAVGVMLNLLADIKMIHIPYKGAGPALLDVIAGTAQLIITSPIAAGARTSRTPPTRKVPARALRRGRGTIGQIGVSPV